MNKILSIAFVLLFAVVCQANTEYETRFLSVEEVEEAPYSFSSCPSPGCFEPVPSFQSCGDSSCDMFAGYTERCTIDGDGNKVKNPAVIRLCLQSPVALEVSRLEREDLHDTFLVIVAILAILVSCGFICLCFSYESFCRNIKPICHMDNAEPFSDKFPITYKDGEDSEGNDKLVTETWAKLKKKAMKEGHREDAWYKSLSEADVDEDEISKKVRVDILV